MRTPSYFLAALRPEDGHRDILEREAAFTHREPGDTITSVRCGGLDCCLRVSASTAIAVSPRTPNVSLVLHGELCTGPGPTSAAACLEAYEKRGMGFVEGLRGSFALAVVDGARGRVFFATDAVGSRKLFLGVDNEEVWVSTMHALHALPHSDRPDPAGLAHCLVNGVPLSGLTPFDGLRVLERASIHEVLRHGLTSDPYWVYEPKPASGAHVESLKTELRDALLTAVERRLPPAGEVSLSLSGGYDSTAILGAFQKLSVRDVSCFTYMKPMETNRSDASVAGRMAAIAGYECSEIEAYRDDVATVVGENVRWGHGLTRLVVETDTWRELRSILPARGLTTFWVADECFGMSPPRTIGDPADALNSLSFADWSSLGPMAKLFPRPMASLLRDALRVDLECMIERNRTIDDPQVLRDYLYLDQRLPRLLSWREAYAEPCAAVRNPLIDRDILDLRQGLPKHLSLGKRLYKETVAEMFPELFAIERAYAGASTAGQWCRDVVRTQSGVLTEMIRAGSSPLDSYLPPDRLLRLIQREATRSGAMRRMTWRRINGRVRSRIRTIGRHHPPAPRPRRPAVDPAVFVLRAITLRELYRRRSGPLT